MTHHGDLVMPAGWFNQLLQAIGYYILLLTGSLSNVVTSYSKDYAEHSRLLRNFKRKLSAVYPPLESITPDLQAAAQWRHELGLDGKPIIGFAGRWVEEKGFDYLLQALPEVHKKFPNAQLLFAGDTNVIYDNFFQQCLPYLEPVKAHFTNLGLIRDPQKIANFYAMCDVFVQPSRTDMFALTQVEAMLCGTPVVASDIPGARVVVQETGFGKLSPAKDPSALAETICHVLEHRASYVPVREKVNAIFSRERSLDQYQNLLEGLAVGAKKKSLREKYEP
jgi:glycosyltransferase involved in cell wall biosynthesis